MTIAARRSRSGITLLEVLVACGVLVLGLASIAALLPAAGSRLGQASLQDRAGTLAANAYSEVVGRGLAAVGSFTNPRLGVGFGRGLGTLPAELPAAFAAPSAAVNSLIDPNRGFFLEDELVYGPPATAATPVNEFNDGVRSFREAICWGATLIPTAPAGQGAGQAGGLAPGTPAILSVAVFRRQPILKKFPLTQENGNLYRLQAADTGALKTYLASCAHVLVASADPARGPRWCPVVASWQAGGNCYVSFGNDDFAQLAGASPTVLAFDSLVRLDQYVLTLD